MKRPAFTIMELLIVILIIGLLAGISWAALLGAVEQAKEARTKSIIAKLDQLIDAKWESYRTRRLPLKVPHTLVPNPNAPPPTIAIQTDPVFQANMRLQAMRDLMRMELPDRRTDVFDDPADVDLRSPNALNTFDLRITSPSLRRVYLTKAMAATGATTPAALDAAWTSTHQGAECLFLIVSAMHDGDKRAIDFFSQDEIGDTDGDGMREILDGWGQPIMFLRWAPGFTIQNGALTDQTVEVDAQGIRVAPDSFDPVRSDPRWRDMTAGNEPYDLHPLIASSGRDKILDIATQGADAMGNDFRYSINYDDPYFTPPSPQSSFGSVGDMNGDSELSWMDNITNHAIEP